MPSTNPDFNITKNVRMIEWLKAELVTSVGTLFKAMVKNSEGAMLEAIAALITGCYFLGKRLGLTYQEMDATVERRLRSQQLRRSELEEWYGEVSTLEHYWEERGKEPEPVQHQDKP
jgi:hypothetical protein